jgi:hypothetical protein
MTDHDDLVRRLREAQGGMHAPYAENCQSDEERYRCERGTCACFDRHVNLLGEAADALEAASLNERRYLLIESRLTDYPGHNGRQTFTSMGTAIGFLQGCVGPEQIRKAIDAALASETRSGEGEEKP